MENILQHSKRSCYCGDITTDSVGKELTLMGWVAKRRDLGKLIFVWLRDRTGIVQVVFDSNDLNDLNEDVLNTAQSIRSEFVLEIVGTLVLRDAAAINSELKTGEVELKAKSIKILSQSQTPPFAIDDDVTASEQLRLKYRYLDLRRPTMQANLMLRHKIAKAARDYFDQAGFMEIETPILTKSTPEGARDYLVPSRVHEGKFYALPQSPQQFKQLLMLSGCDKYFQIARCFRDEDLRADRQPEFTQIDVEMSFVNQDDIMAVAEGMIKEVFARVKKYDVALPIKRLTYNEAMLRFGSDKPDTRFALEIVDITKLASKGEFKVFNDVATANGFIGALNLKNSADKLPRKAIDALVEFAKLYRAKGLAWITVQEGEVKSTLSKFFTAEQMQEIVNKTGASAGDTIFIISDVEHETAQNALGALRLELAKKFDLIPQGMWDLLWVTDFPLLEYDEENKRYAAKHHPFTSPSDDDLQYLETDPARVHAKAYDMVLNGNEIGGGSIRIHDPALQQRMFNALGFSDEQAMERFGYLINAFKFGPPPHGGIAFGLDRTAMILANSDSIRDVIAFPKTQNATCLMTDAPDIVDEKQLNELSISIKRNDV